jgi:hypothetical protein
LSPLSNSYADECHLNGTGFHGDHASPSPGRIWRLCAKREFAMLDIVMVTIALAFFALSVGYAFACDEL